MSEAFDIPNAIDLAKSITALCDAGYFGYARLDSSYRAIWRYGELASWISFGENVCQSTDLLFGLEKELLDLQDEHASCFVLPRVGIPSHADDATKISVEIYWDERADLYHVIIHKLIADSEVELELLKQIRARRLAEQNFQTTREKLAGQQKLLDILMEHLPVGAAIFDDEKRYLFATRRWASDLQMECEPLIRRDCFDAAEHIPEAELRKINALYSGAAAAPETQAAALADGKIRWQRWTHKAWSEANGALGGILTSAEDLTELVERQKALERSNDRLRLANQQLLQAASIIAHDLNAPLRSLRRIAGDPEGSGTDANHPDFQSVMRHVDRMKTIIDGMHDYSQSVNFEPEPTLINLRDLIFEIFNTLPMHECFELELRLRQDEIAAQEILLDVVLRNLLDNIFKHHDKRSGRIVIGLDDDAGSWLLSIEDDGPGISADEQERLLSRSSRIAPSVSANGSGMGLAIVKSALDRIGGVMTIHSGAPARRGTRFTIRWPGHASFPERPSRS